VVGGFMMEAKMCVQCGFKSISTIQCEHCGKLPLPKEFYTVKSDQSVNSLSNTFKYSSISLFDDLLKISPEGFWIRGVKVEQDKDEAQKVYDTFINYLHNVRKGD
jgi:methionyl-tRNA synthetase